MTMQEKNVFDRIAEGIGSMGAVIIVMFMANGALTVCSQTMFFSVLPNAMIDWKKIFATWFMAMAWDSTVLITTVNVHLLPSKKIPKAMALCSGFVVLFFIDPLDPNLSYIEIFQRVFVGCIFSFMSYTFAELYYKKYLERVAHKLMPAKLDDSQRQVNETQRKLDEAQRTIDDLQRVVNEKSTKLIEFEGFAAKIKAERTCDHCQQEFTSESKARAHKGYCEKNENRRKSGSTVELTTTYLKQLNGHAHT